MKILKYFLIFILSGCTSKKYSPVQIEKNSYLEKKVKLTKRNQIKNWYLKDPKLDTLSGISINRAYDSLLKAKNSKQVVVAIIDMPIEINHQGLEKYLWTNVNEIKANGIDDDKNGYIDDENGWNFLGNKNEFVNYEYTRIIRQHEPYFRNKDTTRLSQKDSLDYTIYKKAKEKYNQRLKYAKEDIDYINMVIKGRTQAEKELKKYFKTSNYTLKDLDSIKLVYPNNKILQKMANRKSNFIKWEYTNKYIKDYKLKAKERIDKLLNLKYNDRITQQDNPNDLKDIGYGSSNFNVNIELLDHGTKMAGIIVSLASKNEIKIMPLAVSAYGDEHDKDIALAIRYAVDNGAKVINMSFAKEFSLHPKWVLGAIKYADENNVLIVSGAANDNENIDDEKITWFPNDHDYFDTVEVSQNFLKIGASGIYLNNKLKSSFSNYGRNEVDIFAPGEYIYSTFPKNKFDIIYGGTSASTAITSGIAGLLYSYYPDLTASQIKQILMDSGLEYTFKVKTPTKEDKNKMTPFNQLSKSGKVINAYNALLMAEEVSKN